MESRPETTATAIRKPMTHLRWGRVNPRMRRRVFPLTCALNSSSSKYSSDTGDLLLQLVVDAGLDVKYFFIFSFFFPWVCVFAMLDDFAVVHHQDQVGVHDALNPVGNHKGGAIFHQILQRITDFSLGFSVHRRSRVVQNQNARIFEQGTGDSYPLFLAAGQCDPALAHQGAVPFLEGEDHVMNGSCPCRSFNFFLGYIAPHAIRDVFPNAARKKKRFLLDDANMLAQVAPWIAIQLDAIQQYTAGRVIIKTRQQVDQRGLTGAGGT